MVFTSVLVGAVVVPVVEIASMVLVVTSLALASIVASSVSNVVVTST